MPENTITRMNGHSPDNLDGKRASVLLEAESQGEIPHVSLLFREGVYELGYKTAQGSGTSKENSETLKTVENLAESMAEESIALGEFNPESNPSDKLRQQKLERNLAALERATEIQENLSVPVRDCGYELAGVQRGTPVPKRPWALMVAATVVLMISVAPTLHDFIFITIPDDLLNWFASIVCALFVGALIVLGILGGVEETGPRMGQRTATNWVSLGGGVVLFLGLGILRIANATTRADIVFAGALTVLEIGVIVVLEAVASGLRAGHYAYATEQEAIGCASRKLQTAQSDISRSTEDINKLEKEITEHTRYVELRSIAQRNGEAIKQAALKTVRAGYRAAIEEREARIKGVRRN